MVDDRDLREFWLKAGGLMALHIALFIAFGLAELSKWFDLIIFYLAIIQTILVYRRLRIVARPPWLILIYFVSFRFGPSIEVGNRELFLSYLVYFVPLIVAGWPARPKLTQPAAG